jgi:hypothetical protein
MARGYLKLNAVHGGSSGAKMLSTDSNMRWMRMCIGLGLGRMCQIHEPHGVPEVYPRQVACVDPLPETVGAQHEGPFEPKKVLILQGFSCCLFLCVLP